LLKVIAAPFLTRHVSNTQAEQIPVEQPVDPRGTGPALQGKATPRSSWPAGSATPNPTGDSKGYTKIAQMAANFVVWRPSDLVHHPRNVHVALELAPRSAFVAKLGWT
jgi:hypothetical protein